MDQGVRFKTNQTEHSIARLIQSPTQLENAPTPIVPTRTNLIMVNGRLKKIPRPQNAFMLFANEHRKEFLDRFPNECNARISTKLGQTWAELSRDDKDVYYRRAQAADIEHKRKYPFYHYTPTISKANKRKYQTTKLWMNEQKKSRMTEAVQRQRATLQSLVQTINGPVYPSLPTDHQIQMSNTRDDMQVLTPMRAQQMISQVPLGVGITSPVTTRPRRGRPPKVKVVPSVSEPVPAAPRRGRPRKRPLSPPKHVERIPNLDESKPKRKSQPLIPPIQNSSTVNVPVMGDTEARPSNSQSKTSFPQTLVFRAKNGRPLGMKLIPISPRASQTLIGSKSLGNISAEPITIQPCHPDDLELNRNDTINQEQPDDKHSEVQEPSLKQDGHEGHIVIMPTEPNSPIPTDSKEDIHKLEEDIVSPYQAGDNSSIYPRTLYSHKDGMASDTADHVRLISPPQNPMDMFKATIGPESPANNYEAGWGEPYSGMAASPYALCPSFPAEYQHENQLNKAVQYNQMMPQYGYSSVGYYDPSLSGAGMNNAYRNDFHTNTFYSSGDSPGFVYNMSVKNECDTSSQDMSCDRYTTHQCAEGSQTTGDHISHALRTLTTI